MAEALLVGAVVGDAVSKLSTLIIQVIQKTLYFKSKLTEIQNTIEMMKPLFNDIEKLDAELDRRREETDNFINMLKGAHKIVRNCEHIRYNLWRRYRQASKLDDFNKSLLKFTQIYVPLVVSRDVREVLVEVRGNSGNSVGCSRVPLLDGSVVGFDDQVRDLKAMVLTDNGGDECSVVVVSAAGGCGKTTLVKMVCREPEIKAQYGENIYFVTISSSPNLTVIIKSLLKRHAAYNQLDFKSEEVAIQQWGMFLEDNKSPLLLVLDDVWSHSIIMKFMLNSPGYKILVTSRTAFTQFNIFNLQLLNHQAAINLFHRSASSENRTDIIELVDKLVERCKKHPLALIVIGGMLNGAPVASWETMSNEISTGEKPIWDLSEFILLTLEKSLDVIDEPEIKKCYLDLGLFPEDQRVAATTLMDMWVHLYNHNKDGSTTVDKLFRLSNKNLATWLPIRKHCLLLLTTAKKNLLRNTTC